MKALLDYNTFHFYTTAHTWSVPLVDQLTMNAFIWANKQTDSSQESDSFLKFLKQFQLAWVHIRFQLIRLLRVSMRNMRIRLKNILTHNYSVFNLLAKNRSCNIVYTFVQSYVKQNPSFCRYEIQGKTSKIIKQTHHHFWYQ